MKCVFSFNRSLKRNNSSLKIAPKIIRLKMNVARKKNVETHSNTKTRPLSSVEFSHLIVTSDVRAGYSIVAVVCFSTSIIFRSVGRTERCCLFRVCRYNTHTHIHITHAVSTAIHALAQSNATNANSLAA